jgi:hypothetical protein
MDKLNLVLDEKEFRENKKLTTQVIIVYLKNKDYERLNAVLSLGEKYNLPKSIMKKAYLAAGEYLLSKDKTHEAIINLNKARNLDQKSGKTLQLFVDAVLRFFKDNVEEFSKKDLEEFKLTILPIIEFHKLKFPAQRKIIDSTSHMFKRIDYRIEYVAKEAVETKVTFRVHEIKNALYGDLTMEQVQQEFARLLVPRMREYLEKHGDEYDDKDKKKKKDGSKEKKKKDDDRK